MANKSTVSVRIALEGGEDVKRQLSEIGKAFSTIGDAGSKLAASFQRFGAASAGFNSALNGVVAQTTRIGLSIAGAVGSITLLAKSSADSAKGVQALADQLGLTTDRVQQLQGAFAKEGVAPEALTQSLTGIQGAFRALRQEISTALPGVPLANEDFKDLGVTVQRFGETVKSVRFDEFGRKISDGTRPARESFESLGVTVRRFGQDYKKAVGEVSSNPLAKLSGLTGLDLNKAQAADAQEQLFLVLDALGKVKDEAARVDLAKAFNIGPDLLNVIKSGTAGIRQYADTLKATFDPETIKQQTRLSAAFTNLTFVIGQTKDALGAVFNEGGQGQGAIEQFTKLIQDNRDGLIQFARDVRGVVMPAVTDLILILSGKSDQVAEDSVFKGLSVDVPAAARAIRQAITGVILPAFQALRDGAQLISDGIKFVFGREISANALLIGAAVLQLTGAFKLLGASVALARAGVGLLAAPFRALFSVTGAVVRLLSGAFSGAIAGIGAVFGTAAARVVLFAARVAGIISLADLVISNWTRLKTFFGDLFTGIGDIWKGEFSKGLGEILTTFTGALSDLKNASARTWVEIALAASLVFRGVPALIATGLLTGITAGLAGLGQLLTGIVVGAVQTLSTGAVIAEATGVGASIIGAIGLGITAGFAVIAGGVIAAIQNYIVKPAEDGLREALANAEAAAGLDGTFLSRLFGQANADQIRALPFWAAIPAAASAAFDGVTATATAFVRSLAIIFGGIGDLLKTGFDAALSFVSDKLDGLIEKAKALGQALSNPGPTPNATGSAGNGPLGALDTSSLRPSTNIEDRRGQGEIVQQQADALLTTISQAAEQAFAEILAGAQALPGQLAGVWTQIASEASTAFLSLGPTISDAIGSSLDAVQGLVQSIGQSLTNGITSALSGIDGAVANMIASINSQLQALEQRIAAVVAAAQAAASAAASSGSSGGGSAFASGGHVLGAGTGTSDSIPAWLSNGEFVINARSVRAIGLPLLRALNSARGGFKMLRGLPAFAAGGLAEIPRSSRLGIPDIGGGSSSVERRIALDLSVGGQSIGEVLTGRDVAEKLVRFARQTSARSAGRAPSWSAG